jgi:hypothetical protein
MTLVNTASLQRAAEKYNPVLQTLPFMMLQETLSALQVNQMEVAAKDILMQFQRKSGIARPYNSNSAIAYAGEVGKIKERILEVKTSYAALKEHLAAYKDGKLILNTVEAQKIDNQMKKHPLEVQIIGAKIKTIGEDIIDYLFHGEYDDEGTTPADMFDGYNKIIADEIISGAIAEGNKNMVTTGALLAPVSGDTDAWDALVDFIRSAHPQLRKNAVLYITDEALFNAIDALGNKIQYKGVMEFDVFQQHLQGTTKSKLQIISDTALGTGSRLMLTAPRTLDFGMNTKSDVDFVQIRNPFEDPNIIQFWTQWDAGCRIRSIHPKEFLVNEQTATALPLSGDYVS